MSAGPWTRPLAPQARARRLRALLEEMTLDFDPMAPAWLRELASPHMDALYRVLADALCQGHALADIAVTIVHPEHPDRERWRAAVAVEGAVTWATRTQAGAAPMAECVIGPRDATLDRVLAEPPPTALRGGVDPLRHEPGTVLLVGLHPERSIALSLLWVEVPALDAADAPALPAPPPTPPEIETLLRVAEATWSIDVVVWGALGEDARDRYRPEIYEQLTAAVALTRRDALTTREARGALVALAGALAIVLASGCKAFGDLPVLDIVDDAVLDELQRLATLVNELVGHARAAAPAPSGEGA